ncbi:MAG: hypothetical protein AAF585_03750 [Verrucomicrobiota bacterium]
MKRIILCLSVLLGMSVAVWFWRLRDQPDVENPSEIASAKPTARENSPAAISKLFVGFHSAETTAREDLDLIQTALRRFRMAAKEYASRYPLGTNREITRVLSGHNPMRYAYIAPDHPAIDEKGRLTDRWGTPLHFHPVSATRMETVSAGADRVLFNDDDVIIRDAGRSDRTSSPRFGP